MTIYRTLIEKGYFPKELPPAFSTRQFASYAVTKRGRRLLQAYKPHHAFTRCVPYELALPGQDRRLLQIPHPASFAQLASLASKNWSRLLRLARRSPLSRSQPVYDPSRSRAISTLVKPQNLPRERATVRAGGAYLLRLDVSQFYPSLYTHAVGWAIDPKLRKPQHWNNARLLGKQLDRALMALQGKVSQGVPIGNDVSFVLAEIVLAAIDVKLGSVPERSYRWFDDYEIACDTREDAERLQGRLTKELSSYRLRVNPIKTEIVTLPRASQEEWQHELQGWASRALNTANEMVQYFDAAFRLRDLHPHSPVLLYALGMLFRLPCPRAGAAGVAQSGVTQALLGEPGAAQKAFSLLTFWQLNGLALDQPLMRRTIDRMVVCHGNRGVSSDVAWGLEFCLRHELGLSADAASILSDGGDDCITVQALHAHAAGLLPRGFKIARIAKALKDADPDGEHWLVAYEADRQGFVPSAALRANPLFSDLLSIGVGFYRQRVPPYALVLHQGGAPEWVLGRWLRVLRGRASAEDRAILIRDFPGLGQVADDLQRVARPGSSAADTIAELLDSMGQEDVEALLSAEEPYA